MRMLVPSVATWLGVTTMTAAVAALEGHEQRAAARTASDARPAAITQGAEQAQVAGASAGTTGASLRSLSVESLPEHHGATTGMGMTGDMLTPQQRRRQMTFVERLPEGLGRWRRSTGLGVTVNGSLGGSMQMGIDHLAW